MASVKNSIRRVMGLGEDTTYMKPLDLSKDASKYLDENQKYFMKKVDKANAVRYVHSQKGKKRGRYIGLFLLCAGLGFYVGTIYSIKQEKFLDEFDNMHDA